MGAKILFHLNPSSGVPVYRQLMDQVKNLILVGRLQPQQQLPSVRQVAQELEVNPMTVSKAYSLLEREGVLERLKGQGMIVAGKPRVATSIRRRQQELKALAHQLASQAGQLSLNRTQVLEVLEPFLMELDHEERD